MFRKIRCALVIACTVANVGFCSNSGLSFGFLNQQELYAVRAPGETNQVPITFSGVPGSICEIMWKAKDSNKMKYEDMCDNAEIISVMSDESGSSIHRGNEEKLLELGMSGNYLAQYYLAEYYGACAKSKTNGERLDLYKKKALLLLISGVGYKFWRSLEEIQFASRGRFEIIPDKIREMSFNAVEKLALELAKTDKL